MTRYDIIPAYCVKDLAETKDNGHFIRSEVGYSLTKTVGRLITGLSSMRNGFCEPSIGSEFAGRKNIRSKEWILESAILSASTTLKWKDCGITLCLFGGQYFDSMLNDDNKATGIVPMGRTLLKYEICSNPNENESISFGTGAAITSFTPRHVSKEYQVILAGNPTQTNPNSSFDGSKFKFEITNLLLEKIPYQDSSTRDLIQAMRNAYENESIFQTEFDRLLPKLCCYYMGQPKDSIEANFYFKDGNLKRRIIYRKTDVENSVTLHTLDSNGIYDEKGDYIGVDLNTGLVQLREGNKSLDKVNNFLAIKRILDSIKCVDNNSSCSETSVYRQPSITYGYL